jgi:hypothetical protein
MVVLTPTARPRVWSAASILWGSNFAFFGSASGGRCDFIWALRLFTLLKTLKLQNKSGTLVLSSCFVMLFLSATESTPYHKYHIKCKIQSSHGGADKYFSLLGYGTMYKAYSESKYYLQIFLPQRWCHNLVHVRCLPSFVGKPQTPIREKQTVFT